MRRNLHRIFVEFSTATLLMYLIIELSYYPGVEYDQEAWIFTIIDNFKVLWVAFFIYFILCFLWGLYNLIVLKHPKKILWLLLMIFLPFVGVFLYYESIIFKAKPRLLGPSENLEAVLQKELNEDDAVMRLVWRRTIAFIIDYGIFCAIVRFAGMYLFKSPVMAVLTNHPILLFVVWVFAIPFWESRTGKTLGKRMMKVVALNRTGHPPRISESVGRHLMDVFDFVSWPILSLISRRKNSIPRRFGDYFANTWVLPCGKVIEQQGTITDNGIPS